MLHLSRLFFSTHSLFIAVALVVATPLSAQEKPAAKDINARFRNPDIAESIKMFEGESREIFQKRNDIVAACELRAGMDVADVGAGTGLFTRLIAPRVAPGKVYAVDISRKFIDHIQETCAKQQINNVEGVVCTDDSTGLPANSVDLAFICDTYHHFMQPAKSVASLWQALRPGGRLIVVDFKREEGVSPEWVLNHVRAGKETVIQEITAAGFRLLDERQGMQTQYLVRFEKPVPPSSSAEAGGIFPYHVVRETLPNGLQTLVIPMDSPGLVTYWSIVRTGSRDEVEPGRSGFAHFFEHMMFRGTKKYPGPVYDRITTAMGADGNAYTTDDYTAYHLTFAKEDLEQVVEIESDRFQNLSYSEEVFQTEAGAVYGEYRKNITQPFALLDERLRDLAYDVHTYKHTTIGFEQDIKAMPEAYEYSRSFFRRFYRPDNVIIMVIGDVEPATAQKLIREYYGSWEKGYVPPEIVPEPPQTAERVGHVTYAGRTLPILQVCYKGDSFDPDNADYVAAVLLCDLAFGETSTAYKKLVLDEQRVQFLSAYTPMNRDQPLFEIAAMVKKEQDIHAVRDEIYKTLDEYQSAKPDGEKLAQLKRRYKYAFLMDLDTPDSVAGQLARPVAVAGAIDCVDRFFAAVDRVTPEEITRAACKYFVSQRRTVMVLTGAEG